MIEDVWPFLVIFGVVVFPMALSRQGKTQEFFDKLKAGLRSEGQEWGVGSVVVEFGVFGATRFCVQRSQIQPRRIQPPPSQPSDLSPHNHPVWVLLLIKSVRIRAEKTMTATDVTGFDASFSTGVFATFSRF